MRFLLAACVFGFVALAAIITSTFFGGDSAEGHAYTLRDDVPQGSATLDSEVVASAADPIQTSDFIHTEPKLRQVETGSEVAASTGSRHVTVRDPGGDRVFIMRLNSAGIPLEEIDAFMRLPLEVRLERWEAAAPLLKTIPHLKVRSIETKRDAAVVRAFQDHSVRIKATQDEATRAIRTDPRRYAIARDPVDGSFFIVDLSTFEFDSETLSRVAELEGRLSQDRQALLQIVRGN